MASGALKMKGLLQWCKKYSEGYPGVEVTNFTSSWKDGLAFCAIIHKFRPDLIDFNSLSKENVLENNALAFRLAEEELGIPALLDAEDMVAMRVPDKLCIVTYVSQYYNHLKDKNPEGGPEVQRAVKRPGATSPTSAPETKRIAKAPTTLNPEKSNGVPITSKRGTLGDTCTACKKKVYLLERHILEGKLYHRQCYRQSEKGRDNFTSRSLSPTSPTSPSVPSLSPPSSRESLSPLRQRQNVSNEKIGSPQKVIARPKIPDALLDKSSESKSEKTDSGPSWQKKQGARSESPMETSETNSSEPAWMKWVDKKTVPDSKSPEHGGDPGTLKPGAISNGAIRDKSPVSSRSAVSKDVPSSTTRIQKQWGNRAEETTGATSKPAWAKPEPKVGIHSEKSATSKSVEDSTKNSSSSSSQDKPWVKARVETKMEVDSVELTKDSSANEEKEKVIRRRKDRQKAAQSTPEPSIGTSAQLTKTDDDGAKTGLLKSLAGVRAGLTPSAVKSSATADKSKPSGAFVIRSNDDISASSPQNQRKKSPVNQKRSPASSTEGIDKLKTPGRTTPTDNKPANVTKTKRDVSPVIAKYGSPEKKTDGRPSPSKWSPSGEKSMSSIAATSSRDKVPTASITVTKPVDEKTPSATGKSGSPEKKTDARPSPAKWSPSGEKSLSSIAATSSSDKVPTTSITVMKPDDEKMPSTTAKSDAADKKGVSPKTHRSRSPKQTGKQASSPVTQNKDVPSGGTGSPSRSAVKKPAVSSAAGANESSTVRVKIRSDSPPSRPVSVLPGDTPPPKPPRTLERNAKLDNRPEWQIEAERRKNARKGGYKDPEKPWLYEDKDSSAKPAAEKQPDHPFQKNPFGTDEADKSPIKQKKKYSSTNPFGSTDTLDESPRDEEPKYKPANPFACDSDDEIENPFEIGDGPMKTSTMRPGEKRNTQIEESTLNKSLSVEKKRAAPRPPGSAANTPSPGMASKQNRNLKSKSEIPTGSPAFERNAPRTASPKTKGKAPQPSGPPARPGTIAEGSPAKARTHLSPARQVPKEEPPKPEWVGSPMKRLRKITPPEKFDFTRMSSTEVESDSSITDSPGVEKRLMARSPTVRRSVKNMPAPPHPVPASRRKIIAEERISPDQIIRELDELDQKQTSLESKGRILEEDIRDAELNESPKEDELLMQWFEMVNEKNQLVRREADLVYIGRQQELEEMHAEIEHDLRVLMSKQENLKTPADRAREEELLQELLEVVNQRNHIVDNIDEDRLRYEEEDRVIEQMMALKFEGKTTPPDDKSKKKKKDKKKKKKPGSEFHCIAAEDS